MPPVSHNPSEYATGKLARKIFLVFFAISIIPLGMILAFINSNANWLLRQMTLLDQQRMVVVVIGTVLVVAGLLAFGASRLTRPLNHLVQTVRLFTEGSWDQRATIHSNDEFGLLARLFNCIADEMSVSQRQLPIVGSQEDNANPQGAIQIAEKVASCRSLNELLGDCLEIFVRQFSCSYASIYSLERKEGVSTTYAILARSAGSLDLDENQELKKRLKADRINLDTTPTMDWLVGRAIASRRPQVGTVTDETSVYEAAVPIIHNLAGEDGRVLGVLDLFVVSRVNDHRLRPFSTRVITEIQSMVGILAIGLANFMRYNGASGLVATGKLSSFLPDLETVFSTSRRIAEAENKDEILQAMCQALQTSPFASAVFLRPDDMTVDSSRAGVGMRVINCRSNIHGQSIKSSITAEIDLHPQFDAVEHFFSDRQNEVVLISDVNQAEKDLDLQSNQQTGSDFFIGFDEPAPPRELISIARILGCRTAAMFPAVRDGKLLAILLIGSTADMPPLTGKPELLEPYQDLLSLVATGLERIQNQQNIQRQFIELETFWQVSKAISSETDINALYALIHRQVEQAMGKISSFGIVLYDANVNQVSIPYMIEEGKRLQIPPFSLGKGFSSEIIRTRKPLLMFTQHEIDAKTLELEAMQVGEPPKSWLGVPMLFGGQVIGLIIAQDVKEEYRFSVQDERLLSLLATQVAVVVRNARLLEATRRQARQDRLANEISERIRRQVDVQSILKTTTDEIGRALGARRATMRIDPGVVSTDNLTERSDIEPRDTPSEEAVT
jgi:HAMP domain-containing protein